jgi:hypothetical protein
VVVLEQRLPLGVELFIPLSQQPMATYDHTKMDTHALRTIHPPKPEEKNSRNEERTLPAGAVVPVPSERAVEVGNDLHQRKALIRP